MTTKDSADWTADLALCGAALIWGCNFPVMKTALAELHPFAFNATRFTLSVVFLGALHARRRGARVPMPRGTWPKIAGLGLLGYFGYQVLFILGLQRTTAGSSALLVSSSPIWTALIARMLGGTLRLQVWLGLMLAFAGTAFIATWSGDVEFGDAVPLGNLLTVVSAIAWGAYTALNQPVASTVSPVRLAFYTSVIALPLHWLIAAPHLGPVLRLELSPRTVGAIVYSGLLSTGLAYALWNVGIRGVGSAQTSVYQNLVPVVALTASFLLIDEPIRATQIGGGALILAGVWVTRRARTAPRAPGTRGG